MKSTQGVLDTGAALDAESEQRGYGRGSRGRRSDLYDEGVDEGGVDRSFVPGDAVCGRRGRCVGARGFTGERAVSSPW
jgi:hypothetical protein